MKTRLYLQENRPRVTATGTQYFYIGILVALWYKKVLKKKLVLKFLLIHASILVWCNLHIIRSFSSEAFDLFMVPKLFAKNHVASCQLR